jgi:hypothetical protein
MRRILFVFLLLAGCGERDFDQQYADTEKQLKAEAAKIDADMAKEAKREPGENVPPK